MMTIEEREKMYPVKILDIYYGNKWLAEEEKAKGTVGVICKAGQGGYYGLPDDFVKKCEAAGLLWGLYWVIDSRHDSGYHMAAIATFFQSTEQFGKLGWWWDCEKPNWEMTDKEYNRTPYRGNGLIQAVITKFTARYGVSGGVYTSPGFANLVGWTSLLFKVNPFYYKLAKMPLWTAQYNNYIDVPDMYAPWKTWRYWQYRSEPDYSYFNGSQREFEDMLSGKKIPDRARRFKPSWWMK